MIKRWPINFRDLRHFNPLLFSLYTMPLSKIISLHLDIKFHFYVDDAQLHIYLSHKNASAALAKLNACIQDVQRWMGLSKLKLNPENVNLLFFCSKTQFPFTLLSVFLVAFFIRLTLSEALVCGLMQNFPSLNTSRRLAKHAFSRRVIFVE